MMFDEKLRVLFWLMSSFGVIIKAVGEDWPVQSVGADGAYSDCPCLSTVGDLALEVRFPEHFVVLKGQSYLRRHDTLLPAGFGSECSDWDADTDPICSLDPTAQRCDRHWCFVNESLCERKSRESLTIPGLFISHQTCGYSDPYLSPQALAPRRSRGNTTSRSRSHSPFYAHAFGFKAELTPQSGIKIFDMSLQFAAKALPTAGIDLESIRYRNELSNASQARFPQKRGTGCVHDIALGHLDLCLGDLWHTVDRENIGTAAFVHVTSENMYLLTREEATDETIWDLVHRPFAAFRWDLWGLVLSTIVATALAMVVFEFHRNESDFEQRSICAGVAKSMYLSLSSFLNAGVAYNPVTTSGRLMSLGYGIFILISIASFTANTATLLISDAGVEKPSDLRDVLRSGYKVCYPTHMLVVLKNRYPEFQHFGQEFTEMHYTDIVAKFDAGVCDYAIIGQYSFDPAWEQGAHCDFHFVGRTVHTFSTGFYVADKIRRQISWAVAYLHATGSWSETQRYFENEQSCLSTPASPSRLLSVLKGEKEGKSQGDRRLKASTKASSGSDDESAGGRLDAAHMFGVFLIFAFCLVGASLHRCFEIAACGLAPEDMELKKSVEDTARKIGKSGSSLQIGSDIKNDLRELKELINSHTAVIGAYHSEALTQKPVTQKRRVSSL